MIRWSSRSHQAEAPLNAISAAVIRRRTEGLPIHDLTLSNPTQARFDYPADLFEGNPGAVRYEPDALGLPSARRAIASHMNTLGVRCNPNHMLLTASTSEAYGFLFKLLCDSGDEVLVPAPSYPLFEHLARLESVTPVTYPLLTADEFRIDFDSLRSRITPRTRAIVIVSPNNPTGSRISREELELLATLGLPIISDEVFGAFPLSSERHCPPTALDTPGALVFSLFGLSKLVGLPQLKLAWVCVSGPDDHVRTAIARLELIADTYLSVATPIQLNVERLLMAGASVRDQIRARTQHNLQVLQRAALQCPSINVLPPAGGWCVVIRVPSTLSEEQWVLRLIDDSVFVHPGHFYDFPTEAYLIASLVPDTTTFARGIELLCASVERAVSPSTHDRS